MSKRLYEEKTVSPTDAELKSARTILIVLGVSFIAAGAWGVWSGLQFERARGVLDFFLSFMEAKNRAPALYYSCIVLGVFLLGCSRLRPYHRTQNKK